MVVVQLMASPFLGGPERQILGLAESLLPNYRTVLFSFAEGGRCQALLDEATRQGFEAIALKHNAPRFASCVREIAEHLRRVGADILCCNGYKPDILGWLAARRVGIPVVSISHGWTAATFKVRVNEMLDRLVLRRMGCTVCVSEAQAVRVRRAGVPPDKITVIRNAVGLNQDDTPDPRYRNTLLDLFERPPTWLVAAAGRFSPEKGFDHFVEAAAVVRRTIPDAGFVLFGDGPLRGAIARKIAECGLEKSFILAGFRRDLQAFLPHFDLAVLPSYTEGLPVFVLEAMAAGVPVVATAVGGTPEAVVDGITGHLVPPGDPVALAARVVQLLQNESQRRRMGACGQQRVEDHFTFAAQCAAYQRLFDRMAITRHGSDRSPVKSLEHSVHA